MTLPKFIVRGDNTQKEQQRESKKMVPQGVKHTDLLRDRSFLEPVEAPIQAEKNISQRAPERIHPLNENSTNQGNRVRGQVQSRNKMQCQECGEIGKKCNCGCMR